jgi:hypothetical protein
LHVPPSKALSQKATTIKPKESLTNLCGNSDSEGDLSPPLSKAKVLAKQTGTQSTQSNLKPKCNENNDGAGARDKKQAHYERGHTRHKALHTIIEENSLAAFFWWLHHAMDVSGMPSDAPLADYVRAS